MTGNEFYWSELFKVNKFSFKCLAHSDGLVSVSLAPVLSSRALNTNLHIQRRHLGGGLGGRRPPPPKEKEKRKKKKKKKKEEKKKKGKKERREL